MSETQAEMTPTQIRQLEITQYQQNIAMYESIIVGLPSEYPPHLDKYRGIAKEAQHQVIDEIEDMDDIILLSDLWMRDSCVTSIKTETLEMRKALAIFNAMEASTG